jgi:hypothetical protein
MMHFDLRRNLGRQNIGSVLNYGSSQDVSMPKIYIGSAMDAIKNRTEMVADMD